MANVGFSEIQAYAKTNNLDFKTAAKKLGLSEKEASELEKLGGDPGKPVDGFAKAAPKYEKNKNYVMNGETVTFEKTFTLKSGRQLDVFRDKDGKEVFQYRAADGTGLKEEYFLKQEGMEGRRYVIKGDGKLASVKDSKEDDSFLKKAALTALGIIAMPGWVPLAMLGGCSSDINNYNYTEVSVSVITKQTGLTEAQLQEILKPYGMTLQSLLESSKNNEEAIKTIINLLTTSNAFLEKISNDMSDTKEDVSKILTTLYEIKSSVEALNTLVANLPDDIKSAFGADLDAILKAIQSNGKSLNDIKLMLAKLGEKIISQLDTNNQYQKDIKALLEKLNNGQIKESAFIAEMLKLLKDIKNITGQINNKLDTVINLIKEQFKNDKKIEEALNKILAAVQNNGTKQDLTNKMLNTLIEMMKNGVSKDDIKAIIEAISNNTDKIEETNKLIQELKAINVELQKEVLDYIAKVGLDMNNNFSALIAAVKSGKADMDEIKALLKSMNENIQKNGEEAKALGNQLLEYISAIGFDMNSNFKTLIDLVKAGRGDVNEIKKLLASLTVLVQKGNDDAKALGEKVFAYLVEHNGQMAQKFDTIISLINALKSGQGDLSVNIQDFLEKVLNNQNDNTDKIINAMSKIKVEGSKVDLSSVEAMLAELIKLVGKNGKQLSDINAKLDVLNVTTASIEAKLDKNNEDHKVIINLLEQLKNKKPQEYYDDSKLLKALEKITGQLDGILAAIKAHSEKGHDVNVTVDVTGKVQCECNCGKTHEGILGDLNDLLG